MFACSAGSGEEKVELTVECRCGGDRRSKGLFRGSSAGGHSRPIRKLPVESPYGYSGPTGNPLATENTKDGSTCNCLGLHEQSCLSGYTHCANPNDFDLIKTVRSFALGEVNHS